MMVENGIYTFPEKPSLRNVQTPYFGIPKDEQHKAIQDVSSAHVESFNYMLKVGLHFMVQNLQPMEMELPNGDQVKVQITNCSMGTPSIKQGTFARTFTVFPAECRSRCVTYKANLQVTVSWNLNGILQERIEKCIGEVPVMVKSNACNLEKLKPKQLLAVGEEENEFGGYFIINGLEKVVRLLVMQRRNYPIAMQRSAWKKKGDLFTEYGVSIRSVRTDQSGCNLVLHYLTDGTVKIMFNIKKEQFFVPLMLILKALVNECDYYIYKQLTKGKENDASYEGCIKNMLRQINSEGVVFQDQALNYIGEKFRVKFSLPSWYTSADVAKFLIQSCICVHLESGKEKFDLLVFMVQKLLSLVKAECAIESADNPMNQELLLPGQLYLLVLKEKIYSWLNSLKMVVNRKIKSTKTVALTQAEMRLCVARAMNISRSVENVFATGNFLPRYDTSLMQYTGFAVVADKLNFWRYLSHFRAVHRGAFFTSMRTTTVRKLRPEHWGFLCPVHTPDGAPCGLLNHMASMCQVVNIHPETSHLFSVFCKYGMVPCDDPVSVSSKGYFVLLDGKVVGWVLEKLSSKFVMDLRTLKVLGQENVSTNIEICFIPRTECASQYPGIFIFTNIARMMRPVKNILLGVNELIGTMEQVYLHVAIDSDGIIHGKTFHQELEDSNILSIVANQIPFSNFNPSPRNIYECQMGKQTMGTPCHALRYRSDNKLYCLQSPQSPIVRPKLHDFYLMDDYPLGTNAVVAVISYSGYDMEDAVVFNKSSIQRGFKHGSIYKTQMVNLRVLAGDHGVQKTLMFGRKNDDPEVAKFVDADGLPYIGSRLNHGDPICSYVNIATGETACVKYQSLEEAYVHDVKVLGNDTGTDTNQQICVKLRVPRNPIIGDKFASRHGQKGICSSMLPQEDMPFTDGGMVPDILFNPHGFPSRMTVGMLIESMAGKSAAIHGELYDATPFRSFDDGATAAEYFGECLKNAGYDYYGTERMYSGVSGEELEADIFFGIVYYQRLRHMVADKYQVRTTGPVDALTHQPVKGRKRDGGIRFGEMERDSLIAHGASFLLHDRLFKCSDGCQQYVCAKCENILSPISLPISPFERNEDPFMEEEWTCGVCGSDEDIALIDLPYVFRYLCAELAAVNIKVRLEIGDIGK